MSETTTIGIPARVGTIRDNGSPEKFFAMQGDLPGGYYASSYGSVAKARAELRERLVKALDYASLLETRGIFVGSCVTGDGARVIFHVDGAGCYWHAVEGSGGCTMGRFEASDMAREDCNRWDGALKRLMERYGRIVHGPSYIPAQPA